MKGVCSVPLRRLQMPLVPLAQVSGWEGGLLKATGSGGGGFRVRGPRREQHKAEEAPDCSWANRGKRAARLSSKKDLRRDRVHVKGSRPIFS